MKYAVLTFGCRVNQADSLAIEGKLLARGGIPVSAEDAEIVVVNTCSVTATAEQGARQTIRRVVRANPSVQLILTGCYASRAPEDLASLANVAQVIPNSRKDELFDARDPRVLETGTFVDGDGPCGGVLAPGVAGRTAFTLRVQTGCDEECSYCIIPTTRGHGRSTPPEDVVAAVREAIGAGYREIVLTGVHLGSYGRDLRVPSSLVDLLRRLVECPEDVLFRVSSLEPMDCTPDLIALVANSPKIAPHFHLPLQHGADTMLQAMRRPYSAAYFTDLVARIVRLMPHASIGSDVIAGFPGESDGDFAEGLSMLSRLPLSHLHVFPYSDRPGTEASRLSPKVEGVVIRDRGRRLRELGAEIARRFRLSQRGTTRRALVVDDGWSAVTDNYVKVRLDERRERNTWVSVMLSH